MKKYNTFLTVLLIILAISLIILVGYAIYTLYDNYTADQSAGELMSQFENNYQDEDIDNEIPDEDYSEGQEPNSGENTNINTPKKNTSSGGSSYKVGTYYKEYKVIGTISVPKLNIQYPIFSVDNTETLRVGTAAIYPANAEDKLNNPGNVVIAGHNYRNSRMFSKLHTLKSGDSIYITNTYRC